jgi:hypothetical protein
MGNCGTPPARRKTSRTPPAVVTAVGAPSQMRWTRASSSGVTWSRPRASSSPTFSPPDPARRHPRDEREVRHIPGHDGTGGDQCPAADHHAGHHDGPRPERRAFPHDHAAGVPVVGPLELSGDVRRAGIHIVRQHHGRADEHAVLQPGRLVHERVVLQLDVVADDHARAHVGAAAHDAVAAETSILADLGEMPDHRSRAERGAAVHIGRGLDLRAARVSHGLNLRTVHGGLLLSGRQSFRIASLPGRQSSGSPVFRGHRSPRVMIRALPRALWPLTFTCPDTDANSQA